MASIVAINGKKVAELKYPEAVLCTPDAVATDVGNPRSGVCCTITMSILGLFFWPISAINLCLNGSRFRDKPHRCPLVLSVLTTILGFAAMLWFGMYQMHSIHHQLEEIRSYTGMEQSDMHYHHHSLHLHDPNLHDHDHEHHDHEHHDHEHHDHEHHGHEHHDHEHHEKIPSKKTKDWCFATAGTSESKCKPLVAAGKCKWYSKGDKGKCYSPKAMKTKKSGASKPSPTHYPVKSRVSVPTHPQKKAMVGMIGPAWTRGEIEKPLGSENMGTWIRSVYTKEQQQRLGVDATGSKMT